MRSDIIWQAVWQRMASFVSWALAVPNALLNSYYQLAQMCGWEIECFDYSSNSLYQILRDEKSEKVTMVIKIDENSTIVTVLSAGKVLLQRTVAYGVQDAH